MMERVATLLRSVGIDVPSDPHLDQLAIGGGLVLAILVVAVLLAQRFGDRASALWRDRVGHVGGLAPRMTALVRHGSAALLLILLVTAWPWEPIARFAIGLALAAASALFFQQLMRGLTINRSSPTRPPPSSSWRCSQTRWAGSAC